MRRVLADARAVATKRRSSGVTHSLLLPFLAVVALCVASYTGGYQLDLSHSAVPPAAPSHLNPDAPPAPVGRRRLPVVAPAPSPVLAPRTPPTPTVSRAYDMQVAARRFFDHQKGRYVTVDRILTTVYRRGRYFSETHYNRGHHSQLDLILEQLKPGDRYQIEIFWEDGSRRWFDQKVGPRAPAPLYVDEPDPFSR
jgi:hypothetical protein